MGDNEIIKALKKILELMLLEGDLQRASTVSHAIDFINRQKAEIERLQKEVDRLSQIVLHHPGQVDDAIKEFAEKAKDVILGDYWGDDCWWFEKALEDLVKEMVGDAY